jgi:hypothetical protein
VSICTETLEPRRRAVHSRLKRPHLKYFVMRVGETGDSEKASRGQRNIGEFHLRTYADG